MLLGLLGQTRSRWSLLPAPTRGWSPRKLPTIGATLDFALASKRMKLSWLSQGTRIPIDKLKAAVRNHIDLTVDEIRKLEIYLGVSLRIVNERWKVSRTPP
jgi:hypothetical protein